jgi:ribonuclease-3
MQLSEFAIALGLGNQVKLGKGAELEGGRQNPRLLSSAFEALVGAYFLDQHSNIDSVRTYLKPFFAQVMPNLEKTQRGGFILIQPTSSSESGFTPVINLAAQENPSPASINYRDNINYKSHFQEWALANRRVNPSYVIVKESGPDHAKQFVAEVRIGEQAYGQGRGHKKQEAEKDAARSALIRLGLL